MLETLSLLVWSLLQVLKKAKRANCVFALTDGLTSLEIVSFCGLKIRPGGGTAIYGLYGYVPL